MREILFRGKNKLTEKWCEGFIVKTGDHFRISTQNDLISFGVDPATVGQYTGLTDKNGTRIFDGDLVVPTNRRRLSNKPQVVKYDPLSGYWMCSPAREPLIVGNIHDNPELLEEPENGR